MRIYILGINSFIGKNFYLKLRTTGYDAQFICLSHNEMEHIKSATSDDIIVNFCGVNRSQSEDDFMKGNYYFLQSVVNNLNKESLPHFIHLSSYMVHGFKNKKLEDLGGYSKIFIESKLKGEDYLRNNYPLNKLCIIRPSNIFGYSCEPYYNNILVTMIYETIIEEYKITKLNKNCIRNFLSIDGLVDKIIDLLNNKQTGTFNIISNNSLSLEQLAQQLHEKIPDNFEIQDGEESIPETNSGLEGDDLIVMESFKEKIKETKNKMVQFMEVKILSPIRSLPKMTQPRGDMIEISDLNSKRLYVITITQNSFRGNHFHYEQVEEFYVNRGKVGFLLVHEKNPDVIFFSILKKYDVVRVNPYIIHTLVNDFIGDDSEIIITSTKEFVPNSAPDTKYVNILPYKIQLLS